MFTIRIQPGFIGGPVEGAPMATAEAIIEPHPLADAFPMLEGGSLDELIEDIRRHGLRDPIVLRDGLILDGRNRYKACLAAGVEPDFEVYEGDDEGARDLVISRNIHRRHLTAGQRGNAVYVLITKFREEAKARSGTRTDLVAILPQGEFGKSRDKGAAVADISPRTMQDVITTHEKGVPELAKELAKGTIVASVAATVAKLPVETQRAAVAGGVEGIRQTAKAEDENRAASKIPDKARVPDLGGQGSLFGKPNVALPVPCIPKAKAERQPPDDPDKKTGWGWIVDQLLLIESSIDYHGEARWFSHNTTRNDRVMIAANFDRFAERLAQWSRNLTEFEG
jgi:hypothetical protein